LITDGNSPINLFNTAQGLISTDFESKWMLPTVWTTLFFLFFDVCY
jgi:hypothetical protein